MTDFEQEIKILQLEKDIYSLKAAICETRKNKLTLLKQIEQLEAKVAEWEHTLSNKQLELDELKNYN